jgi:hypothetical protein
MCIRSDEAVRIHRVKEADFDDAHETLNIPLHWLVLLYSMVQLEGRCKVCEGTVTVGSPGTPMDIAPEGVMEAIQEHIFQAHCDDDYNLIEGDFPSVGKAWEYVS